MKCTISQIKLFKSCRRAWYLKYKEKLIPVHTSDALETGTNYHARIEALENGEPIEADFSKSAAMAEAYRKYILPQFNVIATEQKIEKELPGGNVFYGFVDGLSDDGCIVEHKTTSLDVSEGGEYEYNLMWDEQIKAYMYLTGLREIIYTVCRKPTIRQKKDETEEEFYNRMVEWYDVDTDQKIRAFRIKCSDAEIHEFEDELKKIMFIMDSTDYYYKNTNYCKAYGVRCEYASICLNYDPDQQYIEFTKEECER